MRSTVLVAPGSGSVAGLAMHFAARLTGETAATTIGPADLETVQAHRIDVVVVASGAERGMIDDELHRALCAGTRLDGIVVFALAVGAWPENRAVAETQLKPLLLAAGASAPAPGLDVVAQAHLALPAIDSFSRFWRPALGAVVAVERAARASAA